MGKIINFNKHPDDRDRIKEMTRMYFGRNPRLIKSFVRDLAFLLSVIQPRFDYLSNLNEHNSQTEQEKKNLEEILLNPGLLAKVIVIREKFPSEFVSIQRDPNIISKIEENPGFDISILKTEEEDKDGNKKPFNVSLKTLLGSWPQFKIRDVNPANFILLGSSSGTEFIEEIDVGQFVNYANVGDIESFYSAISKSALYKRPEYLNTVIKAYESAPDEPTKANIAKSVIAALYLVEDITERNNLLNSVIPWAEKDNGVIFDQLTSEQIKRWMRAIDKTNQESDQLSKITRETPYENSNQDTRNRFWEAFTLSNLSESMVGRFSNFLSSLLNSFSDKQLILNLLSREDFPSRVAKTSEAMNVGNNLINFCINQPYSDEKLKSINLIRQIGGEDINKQQLIEHLISWANSTDDNQKQFAKENLMQISLWPIEENFLKAIIKNFKSFYKGLNQDEKNSFKELVNFFKEKEVLGGKRKARTK